MRRRNVGRAEDSVAYGKLDNIFGYHLRRAELAMLEVFREAAAEYDLTPVQFSVLMVIDANPGIKQTTLAAVFGVERSTMARIVERCEAAKLARRGSSADDRRIAPPHLTARGRMVLKAIVPALSRLENECVAARLTAAEAATLLRILKKLNAATR